MGSRATYLEAWLPSNTTVDDLVTTNVQTETAPSPRNEDEPGSDAHSDSILTFTALSLGKDKNGPASYTAGTLASTVKRHVPTRRMRNLWRALIYEVWT